MEENSFKQRMKNYFIATRPWSFTMSLISVSIGTLIASEETPVLWGWYILVCFGIVCFHATANGYNDYFDTRYQVDQPDSPTARYRPRAGFLKRGLEVGDHFLHKPQSVRVPEEWRDRAEFAVMRTVSCGLT